jgi:cytochrome c oxidase subunit 1
MHYQGFVGVPRRYFEIYDSPYMSVSGLTLNAFITVAALVVGAAQLIFLYSLIYSARAGKKLIKILGKPIR